MIQNPQENIYPNFYERNFKSEQIAQAIYMDFIMPHLKKFRKVREKKHPLKNILHINTAVGKGGAAKVAYEFLSKNLNKKGYKSSVLAGTNYGEPADDIKTLDVYNIKLHKMLHRYSKKKGLLDFYNLESFNIPQYDVVRNADLIHLHNLHGAYFSPFVLPSLTSFKPVVWTLHDEQAYTGHCSYSFNCDKWQTGCGNCPDLNFYPKIKTDTTDLLLEIKKEIYDCCGFTVVCPSSWLADRARKSILGRKNIRVIYNGVDENVFTPKVKAYARKMLNLPVNKKILLFSASGSIKNPQKGGEYITETYNRLKYEDEYLFVNLGSEKLSKKKNWLDIPYIKEEKQLALYYSAADLFIYPSQAEVFGLVIAESMACQTPVIAFRNSAIPELITHMQTGYLAENRNVEDFINGIKTFINNDNVRNNAGINSRERILEKFTLDKMVNQYIELYQEVFYKAMKDLT
jgi:glycosyltransferase involved in cell wall biosynthesis